MSMDGRSCVAQRGGMATQLLCCLSLTEALLPRAMPPTLLVVRELGVLGELYKRCYALRARNGFRAASTKNFRRGPDHVCPCGVKQLKSRSVI